MSRRIIRIVIPVLALAALGFALLPTAAAADVPPADVPADLEAAIKAKIEAEGHQYAGLCKAIDQPANVGKYCAFVLSLTATEAEVTYGPVLSEITAHLTFLKVDGAWTHPGGGPGEGEPPPASSPSADLRDAIKKFIEGKGVGYAGLCTEIAQDGSNIGKYCAAVSNLTTTSATVHYGPVASDAIQSQVFELKDGKWGPKTTVSVPKPPATGNGGPGNDSGGLGPVAVGLVSLALAAGLGVLAARRR